MYLIGEQVVYGIHGVCRIVGEQQKTIDRKTVNYLVLEPVGQEGSLFWVPIHNEAAMSKVHRVLTAEEMDILLSSNAVRTETWIQDENQRKQLYRELVSSGDRVRIARMLYTLYCHSAAQNAARRKVHLCDENFLRDAERMLAGETAIIRNCELDTAKQYLRSKLAEE